MKYTKIKEYKEKIWNFEYPLVRGVNDDKEYFDRLYLRVKNGSVELEELLNEFQNLNSKIVSNIITINESYLEVINYAIKIEEIAKEIQGKVLDGGKLVSSIEGIHSNVSKMYVERYQDLIDEIKLIELSFRKMVSEIYNEEVSSELQEVIRSWNKNYTGSARSTISMFNRAIGIYGYWSKEMITKMKITEHVEGCELEVADQLKLIADRIKGIYDEFLRIPTPTDAIKEEYKKFEEFIENKYK